MERRVSARCHTNCNILCALDLYPIINIEFPTTIHKKLCMVLQVSAKFPRASDAGISARVSNGSPAIGVACTPHEIAAPIKTLVKRGILVHLRESER